MPELSISALLTFVIYHFAFGKTENQDNFFNSSKRVSWHLKYNLDEDLERKLLIEIMSLTSFKKF